jgi:FtsK/SpoIIIE family
LIDGHKLGRRRRGRDDRIYPPLGRRIRCGAWLDRLTVHPLVGQSVENFDAVSEALAMAMGARECRVAVDRPGVLRLEVLWADALETVVPPSVIGSSVDLAKVPIGIGEDGQPWAMCLDGNHLLVVGVTGAGKSSVVWSTVWGIVVAIRAGLVELWSIDPKGGMELSPGRPLFARFGAGGLTEMVELLEAAVATMRDRATRYAGHRRKHTVTVEEPLIVVLVDEVAFLTAYVGDHKLRDRVNKALATLLTQGRAVGVCVIAALQDPPQGSAGFPESVPDQDRPAPRRADPGRHGVGRRGPGRGREVRPDLAVDARSRVRQGRRGPRAAASACCVRDQRRDRGHRPPVRTRGEGGSGVNRPAPSRLGRQIRRPEPPGQAPKSHGNPFGCRVPRGFPWRGLDAAVEAVTIRGRREGAHQGKGART